MNSENSPQWNLHIKRTVAMLSFLFFVLMIWFLKTILPIVIVSVLIAFVLNPLVSLLTRRVFIAQDNSGARRGLATVITFLLALFTIIMLFLIIIPDLTEEIALSSKKLEKPFTLTLVLQHIENGTSSYIVIMRFITTTKLIHHRRIWL